jgi:hypothetical protein
MTIKNRVLRVHIWAGTDSASQFAYCLKIVDQSHRVHEFTPNGHRFHCETPGVDLFDLASSSCPEGYRSGFSNIMYVRGSNTLMDNHIIRSSSRPYVIRALKAIIKYNEAYNYNGSKDCIVFDSGVQDLKGDCYET